MISMRAVCLLLAAAASAAAQPVVVDEAVFTISRANQPFGSESFKIIRRLGAEGIEYVANCTRTLDGRIIKTTLTTDSAGMPTNYSRSVTGGVGSQLSARRSLNRLTVDQAGGRSSTKDYVFGSGTLILDEDVLHQLYFATWRDAPRSVGFVAPGSGTASEAALRVVGSESVTIGGRSITATHLELGTGDARREVWIDSSRRLLKVSIPSQQIEGTRDQPPP